MNSSFKDHFSKQSGLYVKYRPHYPAELYTYLSSLCSRHELAWDCGTGNGQAAVALADHFHTVIATDPSEQQIGNALPHERVTYKVEKAEHTSLKDHSADIITIANALHWFDFESFYKEVSRVLKKDGIIVAWCYGTPLISPEIDSIINHYHDDILGDYWLAENRLVEQEYQTIPFPFSQLSSPEFSSSKTINIDDLVGLLNTWSATQRFIDKNGFNPAEQLLPELQAAWGDETEKTATWKLVLKAGQIN